MEIAYAWASGQIEFGDKVPKGALPVTMADSPDVRDVVEGLARRGYDGETLFVPGLPEADDSEMSVDSLIEFMRRVDLGLGGKEKDRAVKRHKDLVEKWNENHPVGTEVELRNHFGDVAHTKTESPAQLLSGHTAVIWLEGIAGCYLLERVTPVGTGG